jgi:DNA helicase-2/ATP-dependent DNA helicase PcrA
MLNMQQSHAVTTPNKSALILSGAGTGKTSVLVKRLAHLLEQGVEPEAIMSVTFTNKAAGEIQARLESELSQPLTGLWLGTFHSLCYRILIIHLKAKFKVITQSQQISLLKKLMQGRELEFEAKKLMNFINSKKDKGLRAIEGSEDALEQLYLAYQIHCKENFLMDFGELLFRCYELFITYPKLLSHYQSKFDYVLVDECQDTNYLQFEFLKLLTHEKQNLFIVGDDAQSIYGFRGAVVENLFKFQTEYPSHELVVLEQNYRCSKTILDAANHVIANNEMQMQKVLRTENPQGDKITLYTASNEQKEAEYIACEILKLQEKGIQLSDMAILYRTNSQADIIAQALLEMQIPYYVARGQSFYDRKEIKQVLCYLQLAINANDNGSFDYCINVPARGIGLANKQKIIHFAECNHLSYFSALKQMIDGKLLTGKALMGGKDFVERIESLSSMILTLNLPDALQCIISELKLIEWHMKGDDGQDRVDNLEELVQLSANFKSDVALEMSIYEQFLTHTCLSSIEETGNGVQLMTLHASKGLEFDTVFLIGLEQGLFPARKTNLEEERRLMYVGITRAKKHLYITHAKQRFIYGTTMYQKPSVFLSEIPSKLINASREKPALELKLPTGLALN